MLNSESDPSVKAIGLIVNPIAGMGGAVGLKGTDGTAILRRAITDGAKPVAPARAESFLSELAAVKKNIRLVVGAGAMGEDEAKSCGFDCTILGKRKKETSAKDTREIAGRIRDRNVDLLVFCGGDGTARDIMKAVGTNSSGSGCPNRGQDAQRCFCGDP